VPALLVLGESEQMKRIRLVWSAFEHGAVKRRRLGEPAGAVMGKRLRQARIDDGFRSLGGGAATILARHGLGIWDMGVAAMLAERCGSRYFPPPLV
jgi:hypothetical protein